MRVYKIDNGAADCHAVAPIPEMALEIDAVKQYFEADEESADPLVITELAPEKKLKIDLDGVMIEHTAAEWGAIYGTCAPMAICFSEY